MNESTTKIPAQDERVDDYGCATEDLVAIREEKAGTVTIYYTPEGAFTSKSLTVPKKKFQRACTVWAEELAQRAQAEVDAQQAEAPPAPE